MKPIPAPISSTRSRADDRARICEGFLGLEPPRQHGRAGSPARDGGIVGDQDPADLQIRLWRVIYRS